MLVEENEIALAFHNLLSSSVSTDKPSWKLFCISFVASSLATSDSIGAFTSLGTFLWGCPTTVGAVEEYCYVL